MKGQCGMKMLQINRINLISEQNCFIWFTTIHLHIHFLSLRKKKCKAIVLTEILGQYPLTAFRLKDFSYSINISWGILQRKHAISLPAFNCTSNYWSYYPLHLKHMRANNQDYKYFSWNYKFIILSITNE